MLLIICSPLAARAEEQPIPPSPDAIPLADISFSIPQPEVWQLPNGLTVVYYFNDEVPQVRGKMFFPGGSYTDSSNIAGLAEATGSQMREGGIPGYTPAQLDKHLDDLAASIESSFGQEYGSVSFGSLLEDFDHVFSLFAAVVKQPSFTAERLALWQKLAADGIRDRRDDPDTMAEMAYLDLVFGADSPYAKQATLESISRITPAQMSGFHRMFVRPDGAYLAVSGAVPKDRLKQAIEHHFAGWARGARPLPALAPVTAKPRPGIYVLTRDFDQSTILLGHTGPTRETADIYPLNVYNEVFGAGSFGSTLFREIRTRLGLAYNVSGGLSPGRPVGNFQIYIRTRNAEAPRAIGKVLDVTQQSLQAVSDPRLVEDAKSGEERSFVFKFANPGYIVDRYAIIRLLGFPADYDQRFLPATKAVTPESMQEAAGRWVHPEQTVIVLVGRVSAEELARAFKGTKDVYTFTFDTKPHFSSVPVAAP